MDQQAGQPEVKKCSRCRRPSPLKDFGKFRTCPACRERGRTYDSSPHRRERMKTPLGRTWYRRTKARRRWSTKAVAEGLRSNHGLSHEESRHWAAVLTDPGTRCSICGLPVFLLRVYAEGGPWPRFLGARYGRGHTRGLQLDHIVPGDSSGGLRPLCPACNRRRGAAQRTDAEVLTWVRRQWRRVISLRFLWWLHASPGEGGRLHRSPRCDTRDAAFADGALMKATPTPPPTSTNSSSETVSAGDAV